ncbi:26S proteasome SU A6 (nucleomorph) [Guillardia theta]|uniref:26S proteasome SU A6 n=1 Tax=Guillardia theta TaxID=55529 RepID=Q98RN2_GUITH|nr:26s proteasome SU A6 [Guillardia theta]AAK39915.1 26S proteasome SU A6 [Guillardia theta]|mmetsp:Transcript_2604/g.8700  ORF Transcript_2604/g.8700 Transcript_2604/m.8700 type:complete len:236 (+) Transcript_2604:3870-4577(+)
MNNNQTLFDSDGKILQLEFALKIPNQGKMIFSFKSINHSYIISEIHEKKTNNKFFNRFYSIDNNIGLGISGIFFDAKKIFNFCVELNIKIKQAFKNFCSVEYISKKISEAFSNNTLKINQRPYAINVFIIGFSDKGPIIFEISTDGLMTYKKTCLSGSSINSYTKELFSIIKNDKKMLNDEIFMISFYQCIKKSEKNSSNQIFSLSILGKKTKFTILNKIVDRFYTKIINTKFIK